MANPVHRHLARPQLGWHLRNLVGPAVRHIAPGEIVWAGFLWRE
jgi:hypothetical protein